MKVSRAQGRISRKEVREGHRSSSFEGASRGEWWLIVKLLALKDGYHEYQQTIQDKEIE